MAEDFIEEIYSISEVIFEVKKAIKNLRRHQDFLYHKRWIALQQPIATLCKQLVETDIKVGTYVWEEFLKATQEAENENYTNAADILEELIPFLYKTTAMLGQIDVTENDYRLFSSKSGFLGIQNIATKEYLNSNIDPAWEAYEKACELYIPSMTRFCTLVCNLGYLCWQMFEVSNQSIDIYIYDNDELMTNYAFSYGVLSRIPEDKIHIIIQPDITSLIKDFMSNYDSYVESSYVLNIESDTVKRLGSHITSLQNLIIALKNDNNLSQMCQQNFYRNISSVKKYICDLKLSKSTEKVIIIGGGPSLDYCLSYIQNNIDNRIIIVATTVYQKLLNEGIKPDIVVCADPQNRTFGHMLNVNDMSVPLVMENTANWQFGEKYTGDKYLIPIADYYFSNRHYINSSMGKWHSRGTVTGTCVDVAAFLGATEIELVGVDLSYPGNRSHSSGTMDDKEISTEGMIKVPSIDGGEVYTRENFVQYIQGIEKQIETYSNIHFYNLSKNGALIKGADHRTV